jgi:transposase
MAFVPVEMEPAGRSEARREQGEAVQVEVDGVRVRVEAGASQELVARVLRAVKEVQAC